MGFLLGVIIALLFTGTDNGSEVIVYAGHEAAGFVERYNETDWLRVTVLPQEEAYDELNNSLINHENIHLQVENEYEHFCKGVLNN